MEAKKVHAHVNDIHTRIDAVEDLALAGWGALQILVGCLHEAGVPFKNNFASNLSSLANDYEDSKIFPDTVKELDSLRKKVAEL